MDQTANSAVTVVLGNGPQVGFRFLVFLVHFPSKALLMTSCGVTMNIQ